MSDFSHDKSVNSEIDPDTDRDLTITSLRYDAFDSSSSGVPFIIVNITFTVKPDSLLWSTVKSESEDYIKALTVDDPKKYEEWIFDKLGFGQFHYEGFGRAWIHQEPTWHYIEKFNTFWFRQWVSDCEITRAAIRDLEHYMKTGDNISIHRGIPEGVVLRNMRTLNCFWD